jgi:hypothetical protein
MGYSAQVQQSPEQQNVPTQTSGKGGPIGQLVQQTIDKAPRAPDQQNPVAITQDQLNGINSGTPHQTRTDGLDPNLIKPGPQGFAQSQQQRFQQPMGKGGGTITNSATSGQPRVGQPNLYPNTVGMGDNTQQQPNQAQAKGKGA